MYILGNFDLKSCDCNRCLQFTHWNGHRASRTSSHKIKNIFTFISSFSSSVMGRNMDLMDYRRSFRIKIRTPYQKSFYLEVPDKINLMCTIIYFYCWQWVLWSAIHSKQSLFWKWKTPVFGSWVPVLRVLYLINFTGQKRYVTELKWIRPVHVSEDYPENISKSRFKDDITPHQPCCLFRITSPRFQDNLMCNLVATALHFQSS